MLCEVGNSDSLRMACRTIRLPLRSQATSYVSAVHVVSTAQARARQLCPLLGNPPVSGRTGTPRRCLRGRSKRAYMLAGAEKTQPNVEDHLAVRCGDPDTDM
jgi:hypothetical protein